MPDESANALVETFLEKAGKYPTRKETAKALATIIRSLKTIAAGVKSGDDAAVKRALDAVPSVKPHLDALSRETDGKIAPITSRLDRIETTVGKTDVSGETKRQVAPIASRLDVFDTRISALENEEDRELPDIPAPETPESIRAKLESLEGDDRLRAESISGLAEFLQALPKEDKQKFIQSAPRVLWSLMDMGIVGITIGQSIQWDGVKWVPYTPGSGGGSSGAIIAATDSGDHQNYTLAQAATTTSYYVIVNGGSYSTDDGAYGFNVSGTTLTFNNPLPADVAGSIIKLVCV